MEGKALPKVGASEQAGIQGEPAVRRRAE